jgi:hypothetical protein
MNPNMRRPIRFALLGVAAWCSTSSVNAQPSRLAPRAIGEIVDQVVGALIPPRDSLSRVSVRNRKIFFDDARTLAAFGYPGAHIGISDLALRTPVRPGRKSLLSDCDSMRLKPCRQLGWSTYVWLNPISVTANQAVVRAYFLWPDRGSTSFAAGVSPNGNTFLVGFHADVELALSGDGSWKFVKRRAITAY